jgi:hypothetical protein
MDLGGIDDKHYTGTSSLTLMTNITPVQAHIHP